MTNKYDISLTMPAIRVPNWKNFYKSAEDSCKNHTFELVIAGPFDAVKELKGYPNVQYIPTKANPSVATQLANISSKGDLIYNCVDDGVFTNGAIDWVVDYFKDNCSLKDVVNMRYREAGGGLGNELPSEFWRATTHPELCLPGIHPDWSIALHFVMKRDTYITHGGIDCQFEYSNHGIHDLMFRLQDAGGKVHHSLPEGLNCNHFMGRSGDHAPIHDAQTQHDSPLFKSIYTDPAAAKNRRMLRLDNWENEDEIWGRRDYNEGASTYEDFLSE